MRVAIVHDLMNQMGGAERVLLTLHDLFPAGADLHLDLGPDASRISASVAMDIRTSYMQRLPFILRHHQPYLPLYPFVFERLDLREYDVVISSSWAFAKGIVTRPEALHICYCHTPMRWAWRYEDYISHERVGLLARALLPPFITWLRSWDYHDRRRGWTTLSPTRTRWPRASPSITGASRPSSCRRWIRRVSSSRRARTTTSSSSRA